MDVLRAWLQDWDGGGGRRRVVVEVAGAQRTVCSRWQGRGNEGKLECGDYETV
jgi:hypothetical protein